VTARIAVATGAGISAESGIATFRGPGGFWHGRRPEDVATPEAFRRDPRDVWEFYLARRRALVEARPNPGHLAIAEWQATFGACPVITQNVDGLHQAAGSREILELHGTIWRRRCARCGREEEDRRTDLEEGKVPACGCGGLFRPSIVWFGESLPAGLMETAVALAGSVRVLVVVGTSNLVYPAASIPLAALASGAHVIEVNPRPTSLTPRVTRFIEGKAGEVLPNLLPELGVILVD
jgi:NAD-dependent deacetylase